MLLTEMLIAVLLLLAGRKLFWLFVAGVGFVGGTVLASEILPTASELLRTLVVLFSGLAGAALAVLMQRAAVLLAGFGGGGFVAANLLLASGFASEWAALIAFLGGGLAGALLMAFFFDPALALLSSMLGAALIGRAVHFGSFADLSVFVALTLFGIFIQSATARPRGPADESEPVRKKTRE